MKCQPPFPKNENLPKKPKNKKTKIKRIYKKRPDAHPNRHTSSHFNYNL